MVAKVISIVNQKGGVGKTTSTINLSAALAIMDKKVLVVDLDPQGNATTGLGVKILDKNLTSYQLIIGNTNLQQLIQKTKIPNLYIIPTDMNLSGAEIELVNQAKREFFLKNSLSAISSTYDYIFIDCPPSLGLLTINALASSKEVLIPLQCEYFALEGISHLMQTIALVKNNVNPSLSIKGIIINMHDVRNNLSKLVENDVRSHYKDLVYETIIPRNVKVSEASSHGLPVILYDTNCLGAQSYIKLAAEVIKKDGN